MMHTRGLLAQVLLLSQVTLHVCAQGESSERVEPGIPAELAERRAENTRELDPAIVHLGDTRITTWSHGTADPVGLNYRVDLDLPKLPGHPVVLLLRHFNVDNVWSLTVNGERIADLEGGEVLRDHLYEIPAVVLRSGANRIEARQTDGASDDILIGDCRLVAMTPRDFLGLRRVEVSVRNRDGGLPVPCRLTLTDLDGQFGEFARLSAVRFDLADVEDDKSSAAAWSKVAVRPGIVYLSGHRGTLSFDLPAGSYELVASRGMEWGIDRVRLDGSGSAELELEIAREVSTPGFIACDSHLHTLEVSGHGDASVDERVLTLAGEGIELAIATDHNHNVDYGPRQRALGLGEHYTAVVGNEVTTPVGHFNAFPLDPADPVPPHELRDWVQLVEGMRDLGAEVVVLNHPRWPAIQTGPFGVQKFGLDRVSGSFRDGPAITFDAMELVNSTTSAKNPLFAFVDWFALLNHGDRVVAVGTSDSHTVADPVGQGRTYLRYAGDDRGDIDPSRIDVHAACSALRGGESSIAQGIFTRVWLPAASGRPAVHMGDLARLPSDRGLSGAADASSAPTFALKLRVACASWVRARRALVFVGGRQVAEVPVPTPVEGPTDVVIPMAIEVPKNDSYLVCVVLGDGVQGRFWRTAATNDYTLGATNPIWLDVDGDGSYSSPRELAERVVGADVASAADLIDEIAQFQTFEDAVAIQAMQLVYDRVRRVSVPSDSLRAGLVEFAERLGRDAVTEFSTRFR